MPSLDFLGRHIDRHGISPVSEKVKAIHEFPKYLMQLLHSLLKGTSQSLTWTNEAAASFNTTKDALANAFHLAYPTLDATTCLMTDASDMAIGAVLQQNIKGT